MNTLRIPRERINIFLENDGKVLKQLEKYFRADIAIGKTGEVEFSTNDPVDILALGDVIKAIGRGFDPETALKLMDDEFFLLVVDVNEFSKNKKSSIRIKARVIGRDGKIKSQIEKETDTEIAVYGKTISIIGRDENIYIAKRAIETILEGKPYSAAFHHVRYQ